MAKPTLKWSLSPGSRQNYWSLGHSNGAYVDPVASAADRPHWLRHSRHHNFGVQQLSGASPLGLLSGRHQPIRISVAVRHANEGKSSIDNVYSCGFARQRRPSRRATQTSARDFGRIPRATVCVKTLPQTAISLAFRDDSRRRGE